MNMQPVWTGLARCAMQPCRAAGASAKLQVTWMLGAATFVTCGVFALHTR